MDLWWKGITFMLKIFYSYTVIVGITFMLITFMGCIGTLATIVDVFVYIWSKHLAKAA